MCDVQYSERDIVIEKSKCAWCGAVWCGVVRCSAVRCGAWDCSAVKVVEVGYAL